MARFLLMVSVMLLHVCAVHADERLPPLTSEAVKQACSDCHMAYQPQLLPRKSWQTIMDTLDDHFGENASVATSVRQEVLTYLLAHAADVERSEQTREFLQGVDLQNPPLRISAMPWFVHEHRKVSAPTWQHPKVQSKANCVACHSGAMQGDYEDAKLP
jgi:hypothetical protein